LTAGLVVLTGIVVGVAWPLFFVGFHQLFFDPGTWQFTASSGLIRLFPEQFWIDATLSLAILAALQGLALVMLGRLLEAKTGSLRSEPRS
jgi:uncharacterized membrane protein